MSNLFIPILLGTSRQGRMSEQVSLFIKGQLEQREHVTTQLFDTRLLDLTGDEGTGLAVRNPAWASAMALADGLVIICPEYNHGYPGSLKMALDMLLKEYLHKAVGLVGVSAGQFAGARCIENLVPVVRELGLVATFTDLNIGTVSKAFDEHGASTDPKLVGRTDGFIKELLWMTATLKNGREKLDIENI